MSSFAFVELKLISSSLGNLSYRISLLSLYGLKNEPFKLRLVILLMDDSRASKKASVKIQFLIFSSLRLREYGFILEKDIDYF